jgi:hypothetical protein
MAQAVASKAGRGEGPGEKEVALAIMSVLSQEMQQAAGKTTYAENLIYVKFSEQEIKGLMRSFRELLKGEWPECGADLLVSREMPARLNKIKNAGKAEEATPFVNKVEGQLLELLKNYQPLAPKN